MKHIVAIVALLALCACSTTQELAPEESRQATTATWKYARQRVSDAQWQALKEETLAQPGAKVEESDVITKITVTGPSGSLGDTVMYIFTTPEHSGHPAAGKVTFPSNSNGDPTPDYAFHYAGSEDGFKAFVRGVIIGASVLAAETPK